MIVIKMYDGTWLKEAYVVTHDLRDGGGMGTPETTSLDIRTTKSRKERKKFKTWLAAGEIAQRITNTYSVASIERTVL